MTAVLLLTACDSERSKPDSAVGQQAWAFADAYFNYDFKRAVELVTPESARWLQFAASNITQQDIDLLNSQDEPTTCDVGSIQQVNDSTFYATVSVTNYMQRDSIGQQMHVVDEGVFRLPVVRRDGKYYVRMEGLPRSERQSRAEAVDE